MIQNKTNVFVIVETKFCPTKAQTPKPVKAIAKPIPPEANVPIRDE